MIWVSEANGSYLGVMGDWYEWWEPCKIGGRLMGVIGDRWETHGSHGIKVGNWWEVGGI